MKFIAASFFLLTTSTVWANPLLLKCTINKKLIVLNVEHLVSEGCQSGQFETLNGQLKSRYNVILCGGNRAEGTVEVKSSLGEWFEVEQFSTQGRSKNHCYLYRDIETVPTSCPRHSHDC